jgi:spore maturation protein CgeB
MYNLHLSDDRIDYLKPDHGYREDIEKCKQSTCGENYIKKLNQYRVCFSDDSTQYSPYLLAKFFEILSSGTLLLASLNYIKPYFSKLGFIDGEHYISISKENYNEKIEYILDETNREEIDRIRLSGYNLCNTYHTSEHRALQLKEIIENTDNVKKYMDGIGGTKYHIVENSLTI